MKKFIRYSIYPYLFDIRIKLYTLSFITTDARVVFFEHSTNKTINTGRFTIFSFYYVRWRYWLFLCLICDITKLNLSAKALIHFWRFLSSSVILKYLPATSTKRWRQSVSECSVHFTSDQSRTHVVISVNSEKPAAGLT